MRLSHTLAATSVAFDDPNLVSAAGLVPAMALAQRAGLADLADERLSVPTDKGANAGLKVASLVAGMVAGADSIDDMALLRHGGMSRIFTTSVASVYPHYVAKVEKKGRTTPELHQVIEWLTGFDEAALQEHLAAGTTFEEFFAAARLNPKASSITGTICGDRVQDIEEPLKREIRTLDKLIDEIAKRKAMEKVLRHRA